MKSISSIFLIFIFLLNSLLTATEPIALIFCTEGDPDSFVDGLVNIINGDYCESCTDIEIEGPDAFILQRFYNSRNYVMGEHPGSWRVFNTNFLIIGKDPEREKKFIEYYREVDTLAFVGERSGGILTYSGKRVNDTSVDGPLMINIDKHGKGMTNTYANDISGQTNHINNRLFCKDDVCEIILGDGTKRIYEKVKSLPTSLLGEELIPYLLQKVDSPSCYHLIEEILPSGNRMTYSYESGHVSRIEMKNASNSKTLSWVDITYHFSSNGCLVTFSTSDEKKLDYHFTLITSANSESLYLLKSVSGTHLIPCSYNYLDNNNEYVLEEKFYANQLLYKISYGIDGRVESIWEQDPTTKEYFPKKSFTYKEQITEVQTASGIKIVYRYNDSLILDSIEKYDKDNLLFKKEIKLWGKKGNEKTLLQAKGILDGNLKLKSYNTYFYDKQFNVIEESLYGNLSGKDEDDLFLDDQGHLLNSKAIECHKIYKEYSSDGYNNLIRIGKKDQTNTVFRYESNSNLLVKEFLVDQGIKKRTFYFYNEDGTRIRSVHDDGYSEEEFELKGVSERHIQICKPKENLPGVGLPLIIENKVLDSSNGKELLLKRCINDFDSQGNLLACDYYDAKENFITREQKKYNHLGLPIWESKFDLEYIYDYDEVGNLKSIDIPHLNKITFNTYNYKNQLIQTKHCFDNQELIESYDYDRLGHRISSTDAQGHTTIYEYDGFGREIRISFPSFYDEYGQPIKKEPFIQEMLFLIILQNFVNVYWSLPSPLEDIFIGKRVLKSLIIVQKAGEILCQDWIERVLREKRIRLSILAHILMLQSLIMGL